MRHYVGKRNEKLGKVCFGAFSGSNVYLFCGTVNAKAKEMDSQGTIGELFDEMLRIISEKNISEEIEVDILRADCTSKAEIQACDTE